MSYTSDKSLSWKAHCTHLDGPLTRQVITNAISSTKLLNNFDNYYGSLRWSIHTCACQEELTYLQALKVLVSSNIPPFLAPTTINSSQLSLITSKQLMLSSCKMPINQKIKNENLHIKWFCSNPCSTQTTIQLDIYKLEYKFGSTPWNPATHHHRSYSREQYDQTAGWVLMKPEPRWLYVDTLVWTKLPTLRTKKFRRYKVGIFSFLYTRKDGCRLTLHHIIDTRQNFLFIVKLTIIVCCSDSSGDCWSIWICYLTVGS